MSNEKNKLPVNLDNSLKTVFIDSLSINTRSDDIHYLSFLTSLPNGLYEQFRAIIPKKEMKDIIDVLCRECNYFPSKENTRKKTS